VSGAPTKVNAQAAREHGLSEEEFGRILKILGRDPTWTELGIFSVMWSEHCSYKSSRVHLRQLPTSGERVIHGPGENAGVVDIGDGDAVIFKMESHNHPSFIEPYQGAATGVGGILRDVFTMGARPVACMDALRFGRPEHEKTAHLVEGVVAGIGGYGNAFGVPTVGGDVSFDGSYDGNILVNAMAVGLARQDRIFLGRASGVGNPVLYIGAKTGRDGIHGATMASAEFDEHSDEKRPTVQVGDPFTEKLLLEACLELMAGDCLVGIQDMGAAGLTSSSVEMAGRAGSGLRLDLDKVPRRERGMTPYELMLSESQERMLLVAKRGREGEVIAICDKWDIDSAVVGEVTESGRIVVVSDGEEVASIPIAPLTEGLKYERPMARPAYLDELQRFDPSSIAAPADLGKTLLQILESPSVASKEWVYRQYDHQVGDNTIVRPGSDAAVVRVRHPESRAVAQKGLAITTDCNSRFCWLDPYEGARLAVAESYRNISATGGEPLAVTDCLNFGNPERPEIMWQFAECVRGIADACRALGTPVVSGNVSLYNETAGTGIHPTPMIGMVGLLPRVDDAVTSGFAAAGHEVALLGMGSDEIGGSEYLQVAHGKSCGRPPRFDAAREIAVGKAAVAMARARLISSAHDCSDGGLGVALAECCLTARQPIGAALHLDGELRADFQLFGEAPARIVISYPQDHAAKVAAIAAEHGAPLTRLGSTGGHRLVIQVGGRPAIDLSLDEIGAAWRGGFRKVVGA
jgi:phosphoribosylformylglycinamidine synthase